MTSGYIAALLLAMALPDVESAAVYDRLEAAPGPWAEAIDLETGAPLGLWSRRVAPGLGVRYMPGLEGRYLPGIEGRYMPGLEGRRLTGLE